MGKISIVVAVACAMSCVATARVDTASEGGLVRISGKGKLVLVDCGAGIDRDALAPALARFGTCFHVETEWSQGETFSVSRATAMLERIGGNAAVFFGCAPGLPLSLSAPEEKWAFVNIAPLKADGSDQEKYAKRLGVMFMRAACRVLGADAANTPDSCLYTVYSVADLDAIKELNVTMNAFISIREALKRLGIEPVETMTYREACEEGVAPPPTNDVQRAIWSKYNKE